MDILPSRIQGGNGLGGAVPIGGGLVLRPATKPPSTTGRPVGTIQRPDKLDRVVKVTVRLPGQEHLALVALAHLGKTTQSETMRQLLRDKARGCHLKHGLFRSEACGT